MLVLGDGKVQHQSCNLRYYGLVSLALAAFAGTSSGRSKCRSRRHMLPLASNSNEQQHARIQRQHENQEREHRILSPSS